MHLDSLFQQIESVTTNRYDVEGVVLCVKTLCSSGDAVNI